MSNLRPARIQKKAYKRADGTSVKAHAATVNRRTTPAANQVRGPVAGPVTSTTPSPSALGIKTPPPLANLVVNEFMGWDAAFDGTRTGFEINRRTGRLSGYSEHESVNSYTRDEASGNVISFDFGRPLGRDEMNDLVRESLEDLGILVATHSEEWDGQNFVANNSDAADAAIERIAARLEDNSYGEPSAYEIETYEALEALVDGFPEPDGVKVDACAGAWTVREYTDLRTGRSVIAVYRPDDEEGVREVFDVAMAELANEIAAFDEDAAWDEAQKDPRDPAEVARIQEQIDRYDETIHGGPSRPEFDEWHSELRDYMDSTREE